MENELLFSNLNPPEKSQPKPSAPTQKTTTTNTSPLAYKLAPKTFDDYVGQEHIISPGKPLRELIEKDALTSIIIWGPPGCGKTGLARLIATQTSANFIQLNAVTAKIADIKDAITKATYNRRQNLKTILFIDEIHRFSKTQQDALLPEVENGLLTLIGATTENPYFSVIPALISRSQIYECNPLTEDHLDIILTHALNTLNHPITLDSEAKTTLIHYAKGDARKLLNTLEILLKLGQKNITKEELEKITLSKGIAHSTDAHYDITSAFIKSMRGSDSDAAIYWLTRLLKGGEDPQFIGRRLVIFASEDIGLADPNALLLATAAFQATKTIGMPEVAINLSHVTTYLAKAPKSNATYKALKKAYRYIDNGGIHNVPNHLKDAHYKGAKDLGHGKDYLYPHDYPNAQVEQRYWDGDTTFF